MGEDDAVINTVEEVVVVTPSPSSPPLPPQQQQQDERIQRQPLPSSSSSSSGGGGVGDLEEEDETTVLLLLEILSNEIFKDGGASLVTSLKMYIPSTTKQFDSYLRKVQSKQQQRSGIGGGHVKVSLMKFLEDHNMIFNVDRNVVPHWVILLNNKYVTIEIEKDDDANNRTTTTNTNDDDNDDDDSTKIIEEEEEQQSIMLLWERVLYVLRNRQAKLERRIINYNQKKKNNATTTTTTPPPPSSSTTTTVESSTLSNNTNPKNNNFNQHNTPNNNVSSFWLIKQCQWEFHYYLRTIGYYIKKGGIYSNPYQVQPVGTKLWQDLVVSKFEDFIRNQITTIKQQHQHNNQNNIATTTTTSSTNNDNNHQQCCLICDVRDNKIWLSPKIITTTETTTTTPVSSSSTTTNITTNGNNDVATTHTNSVNGIDDATTCSFQQQQQQDYWNQLEELLTQLIQNDGGHQVSLDLLLHRHSNLKRMLGGRDFWKLYHDQYNNHNHNHDFGGDCSGEQVLVETEGGKASSSLSSSPSSWYAERNNDNNRIVIKKLINSHHKKNGLDTPRMDIEDEEGLFSVTNGKWGIAMANILLNSCRKIWIMSMRERNLEVIKGDRNSNGCSSNDNQEDKNNHDDDDDDKYNKRILKLNNVYAIDMTASIGGMTLGLAKTRSFTKIIAIEIDKGRAKLCQQNMIKHGISDIVQVWNDDSVEALSSSKIILPVLTTTNDCNNMSPPPPPTDVDVDVGDNNNPTPPQPPPPLCIVIDPPWGGYEFKQKLRNNKKQQQKSNTSNAKKESSSSSSLCSLRMGSWSLEEVIEQIAIHISSKSCGGVVVGLRLPTTFDLDNFIATLESDDGHYQLDLSILDMRKLSVQLFVVLNIKGKKKKTELIKKKSSKMA